jgi:Chlorophyll A-B binding protein
MKTRLSYVLTGFVPHSQHINRYPSLSPRIITKWCQPRFPCDKYGSWKLQMSYNGNQLPNDEYQGYGEDDFGEDEDNTFLLEQLERMEMLDESYNGNENEIIQSEDIEFSLNDDDDDFVDLLFDDMDYDDFVEEFSEVDNMLLEGDTLQGIPTPAARNLEVALLQGVVPAGAGVGSQCLPGDWGFDPFNLATKDLIGQTQRYLWALFPVDNNTNGYNNVDGDITSNNIPRITETFDTDRPLALILRDYREAEIRHGRLAMLASLFWPLQEMVDRLLLDESQFGSLIYSTGVTLPYIPLFMTAIMLLLGYLDVYSQSVKDVDKIGEAFLPGDCFWDPLSILEGAPSTMKRNMQERELFNGRMAMLAIAVYFWEEYRTHLPIISIESNELLFEPAYTVPFIQQWLDSKFSPGFPMDAEATKNIGDYLSNIDLLE